MPGPPPPPPPTFNLGGSSADQGRGALLQSIRAGKPLKKTVTVDKSAPAIAGKIKDAGANSGTTISNTKPAIGSTNGSSNGNPMGLGGLFAGGMPKLKPTGLRNNSSHDKPQTPPIGSATLPSVKRGPPPVPPPAAQKPVIMPVGHLAQDSHNAVGSESPRGGYGKPTQAPKPPSQAPNVSALHNQQQSFQKPSPPPKKLSLTTSNSVSRAQSMRLPRSPQVLAPTPPSLHQSQDCLNEPQPRPITRVLKPPGVRPPSPPIARNNGTTTNTQVTRVAPPPPPCRAPSAPPPPPPPLPHRGNHSSGTSIGTTTTNQQTSLSSSTSVPHSRLAPPVPPPPTPATPPTPPTRHQSLRNGQISSTSSSVVTSPAEFEAKFVDLFHSIANFPAPEPFRGVPKVYNSKAVAAAKQQAPAPPQRSVSNAGRNLSGTKPQWHQTNAASSAC